MTRQMRQIDVYVETIITPCLYKSTWTSSLWYSIATNMTQTLFNT